MNNREELLNKIKDLKEELEKTEKALEKTNNYVKIPVNCMFVRAKLGEKFQEFGISSCGGEHVVFPSTGGMINYDAHYRSSPKREHLNKGIVLTDDQARRVRQFAVDLVKDQLI